MFQTEPSAFPQGQRAPYLGRYRLRGSPKDGGQSPTREAQTKDYGSEGTSRNAPQVRLFGQVFRPCSPVPDARQDRASGGSKHGKGLAIGPCVSLIVRDRGPSRRRGKGHRDAMIPDAWRRHAARRYARAARPCTIHQSRPSSTSTPAAAGPRPWRRSGRFPSRRQFLGRPRMNGSAPGIRATTERIGYSGRSCCARSGAPPMPVMSGE